MRAAVTPNLDALGAVVDGLDPSRLDDASTLALLRESLRRHRVLILRLDRALDDDAFVRLARRFGSLFPAAGRARPGGHPDILAIVTDERNGPRAGGWPASGLPWHQDHSGLPTPAKESFLTPVELPPGDGGATRFLDLVAALEALPPDERHRLRASTVRCVLPPRHALRLGCPWPGEFRMPMGLRHPETGVEALWVGPGFSQIDGLDPAASNRRRDELIAHAERRGRLYRHVWRPDDLVIFDNLSVMHAREPCDHRHRREMRQVSTRVPAPLSVSGP